ncbi:CBS domain-containing protein [Yinghuangia seranimata]|uniref:CBS domain-containing protein n=1 Tax=Yinghuangia seranimata TaxID=408067 RepID=UPI00248B93C5|nr:CBS domain-containing protein [Yinghuangia seranimata]MDI2124798.1 CBS domain-containing protein [Yinghuangia seranimata]
MDDRTQAKPKPQADPPQDYADLCVRDVMSVALVTVAEDESVLMAWEILQRTGFHHLPVVDANGRCRGLVERSDLAVECALPATTLSERYMGDVVQSHRRIQVRDDAPVPHAAALMARSGVDAAVVVDADSTFVGLLTARDLVAVVAGRPRRRTAPAGTGPMLFSLEPVLPYPFDD